MPGSHAQQHTMQNKRMELHILQPSATQQNHLELWGPTDAKTRNCRALRQPPTKKTAGTS
eukprot:2116408-Lingulodinium_polyedra.AAC.1